VEGRQDSETQRAEQGQQLAVENFDHFVQDGVRWKTLGEDHWQMPGDLGVVELVKQDLQRQLQPPQPPLEVVLM
jgi:hypothetical protein